MIAVAHTKRRDWTEREIEVVRAEYGRFTAREIGEAISRSAGSVHQRAYLLGLVQRNRTPAERKKLERLIHRRLRAGWSDSEIAAKGHCSRRWVQDIRRTLGLAPSGRNARYRRRVAERTRAQAAAAGVRSLAEVRVLAFRRFAAEQGWPSDLRPRHVQILNILHQHGPKTRRELADLMGLEWHGSRSSLKSCDPEGSYLAHLMKRGLVVNLGRLVKGQGSGFSRCMYSLPLHVRPEPKPRKEAHA